MKKLLLCFSFFIFSFSFCHAQSWVWAKQGIGCENKNVEGESVAIDKLGNVYFAGYFEDTLAIGADTLNAGKSNYSVFLAKYTPSGKVLWMRQSFGAGTVYCEQFAFSVAVDTSDNVYIAGEFVDTAYFGSYKLTNTGLGYSNAFLVKYDSSGNVLWAKQSLCSGKASGEGDAVTVDGQNNVEVAGRFRDSITFSPYTLYDFSEYFLVKYDPNGNVIWAIAPATNQNSIVFDIVADALGNTYVTGTLGTDDLYLGKDTLDVKSGGFFLAKYNANGKPIWGQQSINAGDARGYSITLDATKNVYITGYYYGPALVSKDTLTPYSNYNLFIAKYDTSGHFKWAANTIKLNNNSQWFGYALSADKYSNIYLLGGGFDIPADIELSNTKFSLNNVSGASLLVEYDSTGKLSCGTLMDIAGDDPSGIAANPQGDYIYWGGDLKDTVTLGSNKIGPTIPYGNTEWMFLAKWQTCSAANSVSISPGDSICPGGHVQLQASGGTNYSWSPSVGLSCTVCPNPVATPTTTTTYTLTATNQEGNPVRDSVTVKVIPLPNLTINPKKDSVCIGGSIAISSSGASTYRWIPATGLNCTTCNNPTATPTITTTYTVIGANSLGCTDTITATVVITPLPQVTITPLQKICAGDSVILTATGGGTYQWSTGSDSSSITVRPLTPTGYTVTVTKGCTQTATTSVDVIYPDLFACCDTAILYGNTVNLYAQLSTHYKWIPSTGLNCDTCPNVIASPAVTTTYTITGTDSLGCQIERIVTVLVENVCNSYNVPNVFSPNGDGVNDVFEINANDMASYSISIYDRWGQELFSSTNPAQPWNGKTKAGSDAPAGVYYYIVKSTCKDGRANEKQGFVQMIR